MYQIHYQYFTKVGRISDTYQKSVFFKMFCELLIIQICEVNNINGGGCFLNNKNDGSLLKEVAVIG